MKLVLQGQQRLTSQTPDDFSSTPSAHSVGVFMMKRPQLLVSRKTLTDFECMTGSHIEAASAGEIAPLTSSQANYFST